MKSFLLGLGLCLAVSFLDLGQVWSTALANELSEAHLALKSNDYQKVIELLSPKVEKLSREGLVVLAKAYSASNNHEAAIKAYTACLSKNARDYEAKTWIGGEQLALGRDKEAMATLKESLEINPKFTPTYKELVRYYEKKKNPYEQRLLYEDMIKNVGETAEAVTQLCELSTKDRLYDLAFTYCLRGIALSPTTPENYVYLGIASKETGQSEKSESYLKKAAKDFQKSELAQLTYAQFLDEKKNFIGSYSYYKQAVAAKSDSTLGLVGLGNSSLEIQKYAESLAAFTKACQLDRKNLPAFRKAANTLRTMKLQDWTKKFETAIDACSN
jgi:tetratricopeptide (TPR) repeat protein